MIRFATPDMLPALRELWMTCFGDDVRYVRFAFHTLIRPRDMLVSLNQDSAPTAMLCMREAGLRAPGLQETRCAYIYGVATLPDYRGKGLSTVLLEGAHRYLTERGVAASVLVPASEQLFDFYGKRGYESAFSIKKVNVSAVDVPPPPRPCALAPSALDKLEEPRARCFADSRLLVRWKRDYLAGIDAECRLAGGEVLRFTCVGQSGYAVCYRMRARVVVKELAGAEGSVLESVLAALHARFRAEAYTVYLRADKQAEFSNTVLPFAMIRWYDSTMKTHTMLKNGAPAYIAHVLD